MKLLFFAGVGGFVGTCARYLVGRWCTEAYPGSFPVGTLVVNLVGCLLIGLLYGIIERYDALSREHTLLLVTGLCGGFTTFSTFALDTLTMIDRGAWATVAIYLAVSLIVGIVLVALGRYLITAL